MPFFLQDGTPTSKTFDHVPSEIGAEEAEEVGVEHLLRLVVVCTMQLLRFKKKFAFHCQLNRVVLDSPVRSTLFTLDRQNSNQASENTCAEAVPSTPPSQVVWSE